MDNKIKIRLERAKEVAKKAGDFALRKRINNDFDISKKALNDFVTSADKETETLIYNELHSSFPEDGFYGEESGEIKGNGRWIVDPIDGTTNYFRNLPHWAVSIAYEISPLEPVLGVVYSPALNELYYASKDFGSFKNGEEVKVSKTDSLDLSINVCVPPHRHKELYNDYIKEYAAIGKATSDIRSYGSCALELSYIASGCIDSYYELELGYYDFAAGMIICTEAGGRVNILNLNTKSEEDRFNLLASNGLLQNKFEEILLR